MTKDKCRACGHKLSSITVARKAALNSRAADGICGECDGKMRHIDAKAISGARMDARRELGRGGMST